jgi:hypothetical protein
MVSLLGSNVFKLGTVDIEYVLRTMYLKISHKFGNQGVMLLQQPIEAPFDRANLLKLGDSGMSSPVSKVEGVV